MLLSTCTCSTALLSVWDGDVPAGRRCSYDGRLFRVSLRGHCTKPQAVVPGLCEGVCLCYTCQFGGHALSLLIPNAACVLTEPNHQIIINLPACHGTCVPWSIQSHHTLYLLLWRPHFPALLCVTSVELCLFRSLHALVSVGYDQCFTVHTMSCMRGVANCWWR